MTIPFRQKQGFGRFELRGFLGRGANGDVHLAYDPDLGIEVALKLVRIEAIADDALEAERKGAELQRRVAGEAPQVAAVYEYGDLDDHFYIVMEYIEGSDLARVLAEARDQPLDSVRAVGIAVELCDVLESLHRYTTEIEDKEIRSIIHGDLKPENIRLQADDTVRLLDFGIAKHLSLTRNNTRNLFGTYPYTPPERLRTGRVDAMSDLWAVGVILYLMVSGQRPYPADDPEQLEHMILTRPPSPLPAECEPGLRTILERCLALDPDRRYPGASELREVLTDWLEMCSGDATSAHGETASPDGRIDQVDQVAQDGQVDQDIQVDQVRPSVSAGPDALLALDPSTPPALEESSAPLGPPAPPPISPASLDGATHRTGAGRKDPAGTVRTLSPEAAATIDNQSVSSSMTVRTVPPPPPSLPTSSLPSMPAAPPSRTQRSPQQPRWWTKARRRLAIAVMLFVGLQVCAQRSADRVVETLRKDSNPDVRAAWSQYRRAARVVPLDLGLGEARTEVRAALVEAADRVLHSFRQDLPQTRQTDWERANDYLSAALEIDHDDYQSRAKLYYTRAHIDRIEAKSLEERDAEAASRRWNDSIFGFHQAAEIDTTWADPYLGLARIYAYERFDLAQLLDALRAARSRGVPWGKRELAQLADANWTQGTRLVAQAAELREEAAEVDLLLDAQRNLESAVAGYERILNFGNARSNRDLARQQLESVRSRLRELRRYSF